MTTDQASKEWAIGQTYVGQESGWANLRSDLSVISFGIVVARENDP